MSSIIPNYQYDIFISYRQKDNKADHWVTHFVDALKDEIEATFKEDISIYFDENPHDGLLETHDVDQSLKEKIKVLVFIPIISQTYCDPNCFAWQKEFIAFRDFAKEDELGLDLKLSSGNVCKRILPVRIHEISAKDQTLFEKESGGVMRPIDFIYKDSGVNRPLRPTEEFPEDNVNHTIYRNQVNKVANAVKGIIYALKSPDSDTNINQSGESDIATPTKSKISAKSITIASVLTLILAIAAIWYFKFYNEPQILSEASRNARVAIIPFTNNTNDPELDVLGDMAADWIIKGLMNFENIKVVSFETTRNNMTLAAIGDTKKWITFSKRTGADLVINGSFYEQEEELFFQTQVIDVKTGEVELALPVVKGSKTNLGELVTNLNQRVMTIFGLKGVSYQKRILKSPPKFDAYKNFDQGWKYFEIDYDKCREYFYKAIELDSTFFWPYYFTAVTYDNEGKSQERDTIIALLNRKCKPFNQFQSLSLDWLYAPNRKTAYSFAKKMFEKDPKNYLVNLVVGQAATWLNRPHEAINYFQELDPESFVFHSPLEKWWFRDYLANLIRLKKLDEALDLLDVVPFEFMDYYLLSRMTLVFVLENKPDKAHNLIQRMDDQGIEESLIIDTYLYTSDWFALTRDTKNQNIWAQLALEKIKAQSIPDKIDPFNLAWAYYNTGNYQSALSIYQTIAKTEHRTKSAISMIGLCYAKSGSPELAESIITELENQNTPSAKYFIAQIYSALNEKDLAIKYLKQAFEEDYAFVIGRYDTDFELLPLHDHPAYEEFVKPKDLK